MTEQLTYFAALFPNESRRELVEKFIGEVAGQIGVEKVVSVDMGIDQPNQSVVVVTEGALKELGDVPTSAELDEVLFAIQRTCKTDQEAIALGYIPTFTETQLEQHRQFADELKGKEVHVLWEKPTEQPL